MLDFIEKILCIFICIVFVTFLINHGTINFSGVDFVVTKTKEAINSEQGQATIKEVKDISKNVINDTISGVKDVVSNSNKDVDNIYYLSALSANTLLISIDGEEKIVKLIGTKVPEDPNKEAKAKEYLSDIMKNVSKIKLEYDEFKTDENGIIQAYVWVGDSLISDPKTNMLNAIMIKDGYLTYSLQLPNTKYAKTLSKL